MENLDVDTRTSSMSEIQSFFKGTSVFITGATGFLGHVLLSKLLRYTPIDNILDEIAHCPAHKSMHALLIVLFVVDSTSHIDIIHN